MTDNSELMPDTTYQEKEILITQDIPIRIVSGQEWPKCINRVPQKDIVNCRKSIEVFEEDKQITPCTEPEIEQVYENNESPEKDTSEVGTYTDVPQYIERKSRSRDRQPAKRISKSVSSSSASSSISSRSSKSSRSSESSKLSKSSTLSEKNLSLKSDYDEESIDSTGHGLFMFDENNSPILNYDSHLLDG